VSPYLGFFAYQALLGATGYGLLFGLGVARARLGDWKLAGLAVFVGWELIGVMGTFALVLGVRLDVSSLIVLAAVTAAASAACRLVTKPLPISPPARPPLRLRIIGWTGAAIIVLAASAALARTLTGGADLEWDAWGMWVPKAEVIYYFHGLDGAVPAPWATYAHPEYPPLWPLTGAGVFTFSGGFHPALLPLQQAFLGVAFLASAAALMARRVPGWICFPPLAMVAVAPGFWWRLQTFLPDETIAYAMAVAALCGILWLNERRGAWLALTWLSLAAAALTKLEGVTLAFVLAAVLAAAAIVQRGRGGLSGLYLFLAPLVIVPWRVWLSRHDLPVSSPDYDLSRLLHPLSLASRIDRLQIAAHEMIEFLFRFDQWLLVVPLAAVALVLSMRRVAAPTLVIAGWAVISFIGLAAVYWIGRLEIHYYVDSSADRVASTLPIVLGTVAPLLLGLALARTTADAGGDGSRPLG
jgi:hypothetical protein